MYGKMEATYIRPQKRGKSTTQTVKIKGPPARGELRTEGIRLGKREFGIKCQNNNNLFLKSNISLPLLFLPSPFAILANKYTKRNDNHFDMKSCMGEYDNNLKMDLESRATFSLHPNSIIDFLPHINLKWRINF